MTNAQDERRLADDRGPTDAALLDLYDTIAWIPDRLLLRERLATAAGVEPAALQEAFAATYRARTIGELDSLEAEVAEVLTSCGVEPADALVAELAGTEWATWKEVVLFDDALPFMARQRAMGRKVAIVSNCSRQTREVVRVHGLEDAADAVVLSCEVGIAKPDPGIFEVALDRLQVGPARAIFVDDIAGYLDGAAALGIATAQIVRGDPAAEPPEGHRAVANLVELERLLEAAR